MIHVAIPVTLAKEGPSRRARVSPTTVILSLLKDPTPVVIAGGRIL